MKNLTATICQIVKHFNLPGLAHDGLLASNLGKTASRNLGASHNDSAPRHLKAKKLMTRKTFANYIFTVSLVATAGINTAQAADPINNKSYFNTELGAVFFNIPEYKDGFGVVGLAPVSGPFFTKAGDQVGASIKLTAGTLTDLRVESVDGLVFFEASGFYSKSDENFNSTLGSDSAGNNIRFALFNGANGYNSSNANPLNYELKSEIDYYGATASVGVEVKKLDWTFRTQIGPQFRRLNQDYTLRGTNPTNSTSFYNRDESLKTNYLGGRLAVSTSKDLSEKLSFSSVIGFSLLNMRADYKGIDDRAFVGGSSLKQNLHKTTYGADLTVGAKYNFTPAIEFGVNLSVDYLNKVPEIVHATGARANATFVPGYLDTSYMWANSVRTEVKIRF